jgi:Golgi nucleoside diphosphatase
MYAAGTSENFMMYRTTHDIRSHKPVIVTVETIQRRQDETHNVTVLSSTWGDFKNVKSL